MYLSKLEIQGFKSFAEKAVLEFNRELTAIVGPNGSGKSNISDSIRWVLGEQSLKLLRGKKAPDVIFSGSSKKARLGFAEVNLYLDNADASAPLDYREIVITRRIYQDGEGEYLLNKNKVRLADVQLMLAKANFGQRSYSIIGQGMIDTMVTSSPAERKELFDEATGVRQFQIKKDQALLKLERSQENLEQSEQLIQEIEPRLRSLTRQVKRLEKKEEIKKRLAFFQEGYYGRLLSDLAMKKEVLAKTLREAEENKRRLEEKISGLQKEIDSEQAGATEAEAFQKLQREYQELANEKNRRLQELAVIAGKIDLDLTKAGQGDLVWLKGKALEIKARLETAGQKLAEAEKSRGKQQKLLDEKLAGQQKIISEFGLLQERLLEAQKSFSKQDKISLVKIRQQLAELYGQQNDFVDYLNKSNGQIDLEKIKNKAGQLLKQIKTLAGSLNEEAAESGETVFGLQEKINSFITTKDSLVNEIQEIKISLEMAKQMAGQMAEEENGLKEELKKIEVEIAASSGGSEAAGLLKSQHGETESKIKEADHRLEKLQRQLNEFSLSQQKRRDQFIEIQRELRQSQLNLNSQNSKINEVKIELARFETKEEDLEAEIAQEFAGDFRPSGKNEEVNLGEASAEIVRLKNQLAIIGGIDEEVVGEYTEVKNRHGFLSEQTIDLKRAIEACRQLIEELDVKITKQFEEAFKKINEKFEHYFKILFEGGNAKLILSKKEIIEPEIANNNGQNEAEQIEGLASPKNRRAKYEFGIDIQATPPGKKLKSISILSGGEKALTAIALISAIIANNPSPFVVLDEVDAALDEANSERFAKIVAELSDRTQFICITHNRATMHQAAILYGVTMKDDGVSKLLSINLKEADQLAKN